MNFRLVNGRVFDDLLVLDSAEIPPKNKFSNTGTYRTVMHIDDIDA